MSKSKVVIKTIIRGLPFILLVMISIPVVGMAMIELEKLVGLKSIAVPVVGTGSMYPSLFWAKSEGGPEDESKTGIEEYRSTPHLYRRYNGFTIFGHTFFHKSVGYGDMVAFKNDKTVSILKSEDKDTSSGFIKRIIGVPGDTIELRDGFVYKNNALLSEPYITFPRSSYGGSGLKDCEKITVPPGQFLVLGDNRKVSSDSRFELGLIKEGDIEFVLPYGEQNIYHPLWRDPSKDQDLLGQPSLSSQEFLGLVNLARKNKGVSPLTLRPQLVKSSQLRGERLLINPKTDFGIKQSTERAGYSNIILGEFISRGHFSAQELLENLLFNQSSAKQILSKDYTDLGLSSVNREVAGCPTQIIVGHLGGYLPATYPPETLSNWQHLRDSLRQNIPSWEQALGNSHFNQDKLNALLTILRRRLTLAEEIVQAMESKSWLLDSQTQRIKNDEGDATQAETLAKELNQE